MSAQPATNKYNLDCAYFRRELKRVCADMQDYRPDELARALSRLAWVADSQIAVTTIEYLETEKTKCG